MERSYEIGHRLVDRRQATEEAATRRRRVEVSEGLTAGDFCTGRALMGKDVVRGRCFSVESKAFEIEEVGDGKKVMVIITERRWGRMSWIRFGEEGAKILLKSAKLLRAKADKITEVWYGAKREGDIA